MVLSKWMFKRYARALHVSTLMGFWVYKITSFLSMYQMWGSPISTKAMFCTIDKIGHCQRCSSSIRFSFGSLPNNFFYDLFLIILKEEPIRRMHGLISYDDIREETVITLSIFLCSCYQSLFFAELSSIIQHNLMQVINFFSFIGPPKTDCCIAYLGFLYVYRVNRNARKYYWNYTVAKLKWGGLLWRMPV